MTTLSPLLLGAEAHQALEPPELMQAAPLPHFGEAKRGLRAPASLSPSQNLPGSSHQPQEMLWIFLGARKSTLGSPWRAHSLMSGDEKRCPGDPTWEGRRTLFLPRQVKDLTRGDQVHPRSCPTWKTQSQTSG